MGRGIRQRISRFCGPWDPQDSLPNPWSPGVKILGTTTRTEYKVVNGALKKRKVRLCSMGNQQKEGIHYQAGELYAQVMKAFEMRLFLAKAAQLGLLVFKSDRLTLSKHS
jgi:hypothetical protein